MERAAGLLEEDEIQDSKFKGPLTWSLVWCTVLIIFLVNHADDKIK